MDHYYAGDSVLWPHAPWQSGPWTVQASLGKQPGFGDEEFYRIAQRTGSPYEVGSTQLRRYRHVHDGEFRAGTHVIYQPTGARRAAAMADVHLRLVLEGNWVGQVRGGNDRVSLPGDAWVAFTPRAPLGTENMLNALVWLSDVRCATAQEIQTMRLASGGPLNYNGTVTGRFSGILPDSAPPAPRTPEQRTAVWMAEEARLAGEEAARAQVIYLAGPRQYVTPDGTRFATAEQAMRHVQFTQRLERINAGTVGVDMGTGPDETAITRMTREVAEFVIRGTGPQADPFGYTTADTIRRAIGLVDGGRVHDSIYRLDGAALLSPGEAVQPVAKPEPKQDEPPTLLGKRRIKL